MKKIPESLKICFISALKATDMIEIQRKSLRRVAVKSPPGEKKTNTENRPDSKAAEICRFLFKYVPDIFAVSDSNKKEVRLLIMYKTSM